MGNIVLMWLLLEAITCCSIDSKNRLWGRKWKFRKIIKPVKNRFCDENEIFFEKVRENDTRKMTSCTRKTSNVASYIRFTEF
jgi:hypothetical protein